MNTFYSDEYLKELNRRIDALANNKKVEENKFVPMEIRNFVNEIKRLNNKVDELMTLYTTERNVKEDYKTIINEFDKWLEEQENNSTYPGMIFIGSAKYKLQKLKEVLSSE